MSDRYFLVAIGAEGLEIVSDITAENPISEQATMDRLAGNPRPSSNIAAIQLRCRMNSHRQIRLYGLRCSPEITAEVIWDMGENDIEALDIMVTRNGVEVGF